MLKKQTRAARSSWVQPGRAFCRNCDDDIRHTPDTQHHIISDSEKRVVIVVLIEPAAYYCSTTVLQPLLVTPPFSVILLM